MAEQAIYNPIAILIEGKEHLVYSTTPQPHCPKPSDFQEGTKQGVMYESCSNAWAHYEKLKKTIPWKESNRRIAFEEISKMLGTRTEIEIELYSFHRKFKQGIDISKLADRIVVDKICCQTGAPCGYPCNGEENCKEYAFLKEEAKSDGKCHNSNCFVYCQDPENCPRHLKPRMEEEHLKNFCLGYAKNNNMDYSSVYVIAASAIQSYKNFDKEYESGVRK